MKIEQSELYFIQFLFMKNRELLAYDYKELYQALYDNYKKVYEEGKIAKVDLSEINKKFEGKLNNNT